MVLMPSTLADDADATQPNPMFNEVGEPGKRTLLLPPMALGPREQHSLLSHSGSESSVDPRSWSQSPQSAGRQTFRDHTE